MTQKAKENVPLMNEKIRFPKMQVINHEGRNLGIISREEALQLAQQAHLDLVLLAEQGAERVPLAKIMDFGKAEYIKKQQAKEAKKNQKIIQIKELKLRPKIAEHDYQTKMNQGVKFLEEGKRLKVTLTFRGREMLSREERGMEFFDKIQKTFEDAGIAKNLIQEKDSKTPQMWSRIYYLKGK
ncbi:MAG: translation initiation factor IF-3 [Candidatus Babeliaceae bacterium]